MVLGELNLRMLGNSKFAKHKKIYKKAMSMIESGFQTKKVSDNEVYELAKNFPDLNVHVNIQGLTIKSKCDKWFVVDEGDFLALYHETLQSAKGKMKQVYHIQDVFYDLEFLFASIVSHDEYKIHNKTSTIEEVKDMAEKLK